MKVFWSDRDGRDPPADAVFSWRPFFPDATVPFSDSRIERVDQLPPFQKPIQVVRRHFLPEKKDWVEKVGHAVRSAEKVVLARACVLECADVIDPFQIASALSHKRENATLFCLAGKEAALVGATPEYLFTRKGNQLMSDAVAGTRRRGKTESEDLDLEESLRNTPKDLKEFMYVLDFLREKFSFLCQDPVHQSGVGVRKTNNVQHLYAKVQGTLRQFITTEEILRCLHPTPALCGKPTDKARALIRELEPFDRGLYGGAIGWKTLDEERWAVMIRCCLIQGKTATLYTGAGLVEGSDPEAEWDELNQKMKLYEGVFGTAPFA